jgi:type II secretory pathway component PulF
MIKEIRFKGISPQGKLVQGTFNASNNKEVKEHLNRLTDRYQIKLKSVEYKKDFNYKVKLPLGKSIVRKQSAFSKEEVAQALQRMGYDDFTIPCPV